jgi:hypothetical protein
MGRFRPPTVVTAWGSMVADPLEVMNESLASAPDANREIGGSLHARD